MADTDFKSQLPVRSEQDVDQRVQVKIVDKTSPDTLQMAVDSDSNAHVEIHGNDPAGTDRVARVAENGAVQSDGVYNASTNTRPSSQGLIVQQRNAASADARQTMQPTATRGSTDTTKVALDISLNDESGNAYSTSNPLPVVLSNEEVGTAVHQALDDTGVNATGLAPGASVTLTYTVSGSPFTLKKVSFSASGRVKAEILVGASSSTPRRYVMFNSTSQPNQEKECSKNSVVAIADVVSVRFTNMDRSAFSVYTTIEGTLGA